MQERRVTPNRPQLSFNEGYLTANGDPPQLVAAQLTYDPVRLANLPKKN